MRGGPRAYCFELARCSGNYPGPVRIERDPNMSIVAQIKQIQAQSVLAWEMAVDTAGPEYDGGSDEKAEKMQSLADSCDEAYDAAIETLEGQYADWARNARAHLEEARSLESEGGDSSHADSALEALADYIAEDSESDDDMVTIEEMPNHLRGSHRAAGNWGRYPHNGATRREVSREEADEIVAADADGYDHIAD